MLKTGPCPEVLLPSCIEKALPGNWLISTCDYDFLPSESTHIHTEYVKYVTVNEVTHIIENHL